MVRFLGDYRIKKHNPLPTPVTVYCLGFHSCEYTYLAEYFAFAFFLSIHRLLHELLGYLIRFTTHAFIPQRQLNIKFYFHSWPSNYYHYISSLIIIIHSFSYLTLLYLFISFYGSFKPLMINVRLLSLAATAGTNFC